MYPKHPLIRTLTTALLLGTATLAQAAIPASERTVLLALYNQTNGPGWTSSTNWNGPTGTECTWQWIQCDAAQNHVIGINLVGNNLSGTLPALNGLSGLQYFNVSSNQLGGQIPSLSGLNALGYFNVGANQLTGPIPALNGLPALGVFAAYSNQLTGQIPSLSGMTSLYTFQVDNNQLTGPMPSLVGLSSLTGFSIANNQLSGPIQPVPSPTNHLVDGSSYLCPNLFTPSPDSNWDAATGSTPWYSACSALPPPPSATSVPSLSDSGVALLTALLGCLGFLRRTRRDGR